MIVLIFIVLLEKSFYLINFYLNKALNFYLFAF